MDLSLPVMPAFNGLHVLVVHFPIALLIAAVPVLLLVALIFSKASRSFAIAAGLMLFLGTGFVQLAVQTGDAAHELAEDQGLDEDPVMHEAVEEHEELGLLVRNIYLGLSGLFLLYLIFSGLPGREWSATVNGIILALFLLLSLGGGLVVANTAHLGGLCVHEYGILAPLTGSSTASDADETAGAASGETDRDDASEGGGAGAEDADHAADKPVEPDTHDEGAGHAEHG